MNKGNGINGWSIGVKMTVGILTILTIVIGASIGAARFVVGASSNIDTTAREKIEELEKCLSDTVAEMKVRDAVIEEHLFSESTHTQTKLTDLEKLMNVKIEALREDLREQRAEQKETNKQILDILIELKKNGNR